MGLAVFCERRRRRLVPRLVASPVAFGRVPSVHSKIQPQANVAQCVTIQKLLELHKPQSWRGLRMLGLYIWMTAQLNVGCNRPKGVLWRAELAPWNLCLVRSSAEYARQPCQHQPMSLGLVRSAHLKRILHSSCHARFVTTVANDCI